MHTHVHGEYTNTFAKVLTVFSLTVLVRSKEGRFPNAHVGINEKKQGNSSSHSSSSSPFFFPSFLLQFCHDAHPHKCATQAPHAQLLCHREERERQVSVASLPLILPRRRHPPLLAFWLGSLLSVSPKEHPLSPPPTSLPPFFTTRKNFSERVCG